MPFTWKNRIWFHCEILHTVLLKKPNPNPQNIILETIKQADEMEISEIRDDVDFIWCLLGTKWLYEMKIKVYVRVYVCVCMYA